MFAEKTQPAAVYYSCDSDLLSVVNDGLIVFFPPPSVCMLIAITTAIRYHTSHVQPVLWILSNCYHVLQLYDRWNWIRGGFHIFHIHDWTIRLLGYSFGNLFFLFLNYIFYAQVMVRTWDYLLKINLQFSAAMC